MNAVLCPRGHGPLERAATSPIGWCVPCDTAYDVPDEDVAPAPPQPLAKPRRRGRARRPDEVAVERAMAGDRVTLTPAEQYEAIVRLSDRRLSAARIAERLHISDRTVTRVLAASRAAA